MKTKVFQTIGWIILLSLTILWLSIGYSDWYLLLVPLAYISFSISDDSIKEVNRVKKLTAIQIVQIVVAFLVSVAVVFVLIFIANYLIKDYFHLTGLVKQIAIIAAAILALYPVKFTFGTILYKTFDSVK